MSDKKIIDAEYKLFDKVEDDRKESDAGCFGCIILSVMFMGMFFLLLKAFVWMFRWALA